ncbi:MAG: preprotein translocase subunit TatA [Proteobacteria bacterium]|nr:preprotein translocase subunit TatA [Pseudomonadota bacterium]
MQNKYNYPSLERIDTDIHPVPSVTTVLSNTSKSKDGLIQWRNRVGNEEAERIIKQSTDIGTAVHEGIEKYLLNQSWDDFSESSDQLLAKRMTNKFINDGLNGISEVWGLEVGLILDNLYAGTADCVGKYKDIPTLIDFKTAKKIKKREWIEDYFLQGCAYANAHNVMFGTDIQQIVILMVDRDLVFQEFIVRPTEFKILTHKWKRRLIDFNNKYNK